ncbi:hypothetical protein [Streptomyces sp. NPDC049813]|uniref:hypothetical protein n=1 Tax=Streptomyces sp. NPDC049813 TaxID=3365597 RepID=UPI00379149B0
MSAGSHPSPSVRLTVTARLTVNSSCVRPLLRGLRAVGRTARAMAASAAVAAVAAAGHAGAQWPVGRETAPELLFCLGCAVFTDGVRHVAAAVRSRSAARR